MLLPLVDLASCGIVLWTIFQTRKHLASASSANGKGKVSISSSICTWLTLIHRARCAKQVQALVLILCGHIDLYVYHSNHCPTTSGFFAF